MKTVILQDKMIPTGTSPIYDGNYKEIGHISYSFFSLRGKVEIFKDEQLISKGQAKLMAFMPEWIIFDDQENQKGRIKRKFTFFGKKYEYQNNEGRLYTITGNIWDRKFQVTDSNGLEVIKVTTVSGIISLRPHTFSIEVDENQMDIWEAINMIQGVRVLLKREEKSKDNNN